jgi:hypothetical protein
LLAVFFFYKDREYQTLFERKFGIAFTLKERIKKRKKMLVGELILWFFVPLKVNPAIFRVKLNYHRFATGIREP